MWLRDRGADDPSQSGRDGHFDGPGDAGGRGQLRHRRGKAAMSLSHLPTWFRWGVGALLAFLLLEVLAPANVQASCGDYLMVAPAAVQANPRQHTTLPEQHAPCNGPSCSRRENAPISVPAAPAPVTGEQWGRLDSSPSLLNSKSARWPLDPISSLPIPGTDSIFHPPRLSAFVA